METRDALKLMGDAVRLRQSFAHIPALDVLDMAMSGHTAKDFPMDLLAGEAAPSSPFGQLVAAALDRGMSPAEWVSFTSSNADPALRAGAQQVRRNVVLKAFAERYAAARRDGVPPPLEAERQSGRLVRLL